MSNALEAKNMPLVTSLSDSDTLLAVGADGSGKRIAEGNVARTIFKNVSLGSGEKWIRVMTFKSTCAGIFSFWNTWQDRHPNIVMLAFAFPESRFSAPNLFSIRLLAGQLEVFDKVRFVYKKGSSTVVDCYLEIHQFTTGEYMYNLDSPYIRNAVPSIEKGSIPEGYTSKEFDLANISVGGG